MRKPAWEDGNPTDEDMQRQIGVEFTRLFILSIINDMLRPSLIVEFEENKEISEDEAAFILDKAIDMAYNTIILDDSYSEPS